MQRRLTAYVAPVAVHGFEQWCARVVDDTGRVLAEGSRWSEHEAIRWVRLKLQQLTEETKCNAT